jgi:hypothetical protein
MRVFFDTVAVDDASVRETRDGYLVATVKAARTGIQDYLGRELGKPDMATVKVYRPADQVFAADAMASAAYRPLTNDHPPEWVTRDNWKKYATGQIGGEIARDGDFLALPLVMMDGVAIADFRAGKRELSMGYSCEIEWTPGTTTDGQAYDAIQKNIRINHLAVVDLARGGSQLRIGDMRGAPDLQPLLPLHHQESPMNLTQVVVDGVSIETTLQGKQVIDRLTAQLLSTTTAKDTAETALATATAAHATAISAKDGEIAGLKSQILTPAQLDKAITDRTALITTAKKIGGNDLVVDGKSATDIKRGAVIKKLGDAAVKDKDDAYVGAMFDTLLAQVGSTSASDSGNDPLRTALTTGVDAQDGATKVAKAHSEMVAGLQDSWKTAGKAAA